MIKKLTTLAAIAAFSLLVGCSTLNSPTSTFAVQYATLKVIEESETVDAERVIESTNKVRNILESNESLSLGELSKSFRERVDISSLPPSDQLLVNSLINGISGVISERIDDSSNPFTFSQKTTVLQLLDDVDEAAAIVLE